MGSLGILLLTGCIILTRASTNDHLDEKLQQTKIEIAQLHFREEPPVQRKLYKVQWDQLWRRSLGNERPFAVNAFNKILVVEGNHVAVFSNDVPPSKRSLQQVPLSRVGGFIKLARSIVWKNVLYLLVCHETGSCSLYTGEDSLQLRHRQTIQRRGHPVDATFFVRANRLYLVVADNSGRFAVSSLIYHWRGTYMDVVTEVTTTAAVSVTTFKHKQSTIIVFAQNDKNVPGVGSVVYEFKESSPERIQFLPTIDPVSVHHYTHAGYSFIFLTNEGGPSNLFWWDGKELLNWQQIAEIEAASLIHVVNFNEDTFFLVGHNNTLQLYKFENASDCALLSSKGLPNEETVVELQARVDESRVLVVLVTMNSDNIYSVESWELDITEIPSERSMEETGVLTKQLSELVEALQRRKPSVDEAQSSWPSLFPADEDLTISKPLILPTVVLESGTLGNIDVFASEDVLAPRELQQSLDPLVREVEGLLKASKNLLTPSSNVSRSFNGDIIVQGDASIGELKIDKVDVEFLNDVDIQSRDVELEPTGEPSTPLRGKDIVAHDHQVESLCGIPAQYWALRARSTSKVELDLGSKEIEFLNDTILLHSNVTFRKLHVKTVNGLNIDELFKELFILDQNQRIRGNITYGNSLQVYNLTVRTVNGEPWEGYMTTNTEQSFKNFFIKSLHVDNLHAESINGVPVSEAARISRENVIKGQVRIAKLQVTDKLSVDSSLKLPESSKPLQIYYNVTIHGNLKVNALDLNPPTKILLNGEQIHLDDTLESFWTKSTDQAIGNDVAFENHLTIDHLEAKYLNGFSEEEFLYTTVSTIPESFRNLHFKNAEIDDTFFVDGEHDGYFDVAPESVTIRGRLHLKRLRGKNLFVDTFNGLFVPDLLSGKEQSRLLRSMHFPAIRGRRVNVRDLGFLFFDGEDSATFLENAGGAGQELRTDLTKTPEFRVENLVVGRINGLDMEKLATLRDIRAIHAKDLVIDGDLSVEGDLKVRTIDEQPPEVYLRSMVEEDILLDTKEDMDELIVRNATLRSLNDRNVNDLFEGVFSKSREQSVPGRFSFYRITAGNIVAKHINDQDTSELRWIDAPIVFSGNITFQSLLVKDVVTRTLNGYDVNELYENLTNVSLPRIHDLKVDGNVSWIVSSSQPRSLSSLLENAVTRDTDQVIRGDVVFENDVSTSTATGEWEGIDEIRDIVSDAVIDDGWVVEVAGEKVFEENLATDALSVRNNAEIPVINDIKILQFNDTVARKDQDERITGHVSFLQEVTITELLANDAAHDLPLKGLALATDMLPPRVSFKNLVVQKDVSLKNLDGIDFNKFLEDRVTTDGNHSIAFDVQFNGVLDVSGNADVTRINGIDPSDLVLNGAKEAQVISGSKVFEENAVVHGDVHALLVNRENISAEYLSGVQNDEDVEIIGDLIFESDVKVPENVTVSGLVNGLSLHSILEDLNSEANETLRAFTRNESKLEERIAQSSLISGSLRNIFAYLEEEPKLNIYAPNIKHVDVVHYEQVLKLNMLGEEEGTFCGLPRNCSCPTEYVAELAKDGCRVWRTNGSTIVRNYHELHSTFGVNVITKNAVSSSRECTSNSSEREFTTISWMKPGTIETGDVLADVTEAAIKIQGFVKDALFFMARDNAAFVALAIYYDPLRETHLTDSAIYKIDIEKNLLSLHQTLETDGAWDIEIFQTSRNNIYLLLGCSGDSKKSFLYKLNVATSMFTVLRSFGGKTRHVKSLSQEKDHFILLDDLSTNAVNVFHYEPEFDNFYDYQSLFHDSRVEGIECFYANEFGRSDSFVVVTTEDDQFYIYEYMFAQKFQLRVHHRMEDLRVMAPFYYSGNRYIFAGTSTNSTVLRIVQHGPY
ncbi:uncharacterized protein LOC143369142 [Andrena cerasifolii]|uniref:uncharacterized protein LOC143369142 n=1 Tax=Andrena cerasifolii TaxID=2819439 RepID=UPI004037CAD7